MEIIRVKELLEFLLIKKNNFLLQEGEQNLINELVYLLSKDNATKIIHQECKCKLEESTIKEEVENNLCINCKLPLLVF